MMNKQSILNHIWWFKSSYKSIFVCQFETTVLYTLACQTPLYSTFTAPWTSQYLPETMLIIWPRLLIVFNFLLHKFVYVNYIFVWVYVKACCLICSNVSHLTPLWVWVMTFDFAIMSSLVVKMCRIQ